MHSHDQKVPDCFYRISTKALILDENLKFLLTQEDNGKRELPGGGLNHDENPHIGLQREIQEETWLITTRIADHPSYFLTDRIIKNNNPIANIIFETQLKNLDFTPSSECLALDFFTIESARALDLFPNVEKFLDIFDPARHHATPKTPH